MPLSDEELRLLEQMERALAAEDPRFASVLAGSFRRGSRLRLALAGVVFAGGVAALVAGVVLSWIWLGIAGFVVMVLAATAGVTLWRGVPGHRIHPIHQERGHHEPARSERDLHVVNGGRAARPTKAKSSPFMQRVEARWLRRRERWSR